MAKGFQAKTERDAKLLEYLALHPERGSRTKAAKKFRISLERVRQIVEKAHKKDKCDAATV